jgi:hypothetical protein
MTKVFDFGKMDKELSKIAGFELGSLLTDNGFSEVDEWISTGSYIMNAQVSGTLFGGVPNSRSFGLMGDPGCLQKNEVVQIYKLRSKKLAYERQFIEE